MKNNRYAGVDIGSGSMRLAICEIIDGNAKTKYFELLGHSLGKDNRSTGILSEQTMLDTINKFKRILELCEDFNVTAVEFSATEAIRAAKNSPEFLTRVKSELNIDIRVLNEQEEANFAYLGAKKLFNDNSKQVLVMDIGRGSVELALGSLTHTLPIEYISHKLGTMVFKSKLDNKETLEEEFSNIIDEIKQDFINTFNNWNIEFNTQDQLIGLGMSLFTYGYLKGYEEKDMVKAEGVELSLDELYNHSKKQLENVKNNICNKANKGVLSKGDIPVLATLIALIESAKLDKITLGRTRIPQGIAQQLAK